MFFGFLQISGSRRHERTDTFLNDFAFDDIVDKNELLCSMAKVEISLNTFQELVREYYYDVLFTRYRCPVCSQKLHSIGSSLAECVCGVVIDPTIEFQKSDCCNANLVKRIYHYVCSNCGRIVPSKFLFDERLFNNEYFREMMSKSRERQKRSKQSFMNVFQSSSESLILLEDFDIDRLESFSEDLEDLLETRQEGELISLDFEEWEFNMDLYWKHISEQLLGYDELYFDSFRELEQDLRKDRIWRFITLIFMEQERKVILIQDGDDILVEKI